MKVLAYRVLLGLAVAVFALDQVTKAWIAYVIPFGTRADSGGTVVIPSFFYLIHVGNTGAAWSLFSGRSVWLALLAAVTLVGIFFWRHALALKNTVAQIAFGLLCGGIAGNLVDRLRFGHVVDFIDLHFGTYIYPTFNVADSAIFLGVGTYIIWSLRGPIKAESEELRAKSPDE